MKRYTQEEFEDLPVDDNGVRQCPTGDYTAIKSFGAYCNFEMGCEFGESCEFGAYCNFDEDCSFGAYCNFETGCSFGAYCKFGEDCSFGTGCNIKDHIIKHSYVISMSGVGDHKRTLYVWDTEDGVYCQAGCFFDTREKFEQAVTEKYHAEHKYIKAVEFLLNE